MVKAKKKGLKGKVQEEDDGDWEALLEAEGVVAPKADEKPPLEKEAIDSAPTVENDAKPAASTPAAPLDAAAAFLAAQGISVGGGDDTEDKKDTKKKKKKKPAAEKKPEEKPEKVRWLYSTALLMPVCVVVSLIVCFSS
jgi:hypothetical protein